MSDWREELFGDLLCTPAEHAPAAAAVGALQRSFTQAPAAVQAQFKGPVNALLSTWNAFEKDRVENLSKRLNPMFWCNFKTLAQNAQALQAQLAAAAPGLVAPPADVPALRPGPSEQFADLAKVIGGVVVIGGLAWVATSSGATSAISRRLKRRGG